MTNAQIDRNLSIYSSPTPNASIASNPGNVVSRYTQGWNDCLPLHKVAGFQLISTAVQAEAFESFTRIQKTDLAYNAASS